MIYSFITLTCRALLGTPSLQICSKRIVPIEIFSFHFLMTSFLHVRVYIACLVFNAKSITQKTFEKSFENMKRQRSFKSMCCLEIQSFENMKRHRSFKSMWCLEKCFYYKILSEYTRVAENTTIYLKFLQIYVF